MTGAAPPDARLGLYSLSLLRDRRILRMLRLAGWTPRPGAPFAAIDQVAVWGRAGAASRRGMAASRLFSKPLVTLEDGFLRSVDLGRSGAPPLSITLDPVGVHYDASAPSAIETLLESGEDLADPALLDRARRGMAFLRARRLTKYNAAPFDHPDPPAEGCILVVDQTAGDASIVAGGAGPGSFRAMLAAARADHPSAEIVIRTHPDVVAGHRRGHFAALDLDAGMRLDAAPCSPWALIEPAAAVYAVTSQLGFEAMMADKPVHLFGAPFYAGWGAAAREPALARRSRRRGVAEIFAAAYLLHPLYYDPYDDRLGSFEEAARCLETLARAHRGNAAPMVCVGMRTWKRGVIGDFLAGRKRPVFEDDPSRAIARARAEGRGLAVWAGKATPALVSAGAARMEDGFLRSSGLGAALVRPASLVLDRSGIYYDPTGPSDLEALIAAEHSPELRARAARLREAIVAAALTKYNVGAAAPLPDAGGREVLLVPGQVEDDASIRLGADRVATNLALLKAARAAAPSAFLVYKPHPDVEAGLRAGGPPADALFGLADHVAREASAADLLDAADAVATMTSLMGFEALLRGKRTLTFGAPFYAGWGLTEDHGAPPARRVARPDIDDLVAAALILYPRYVDPVSRLPCEPELIVRRLAERAPEAGAAPGPVTRRLAAAQGALSRYAALWR